MRLRSQFVRREQMSHLGQLLGADSRCHADFLRARVHDRHIARRALLQQQL